MPVASSLFLLSVPLSYLCLCLCHCLCVEIGLAGIVLVEVSEHHAELIEGGLGGTTLVARLDLLFQVVRRSDD